MTILYTDTIGTTILTIFINKLSVKTIAIYTILETIIEIPYRFCFSHMATNSEMVSYYISLKSKDNILRSIKYSFFLF